MKDYFKFNLTGKQLLPIWLVFMALVVVPYVYTIYNHVTTLGQKLNAPPGSIADAVKLMLGTMLVIVIIGYAIFFFIAKISIENTEYKAENLLFDGKFGSFIGMFLKGIILSIITIGIYIPWFTKNIYSFFAKNTSHKTDRFQFLSKGAQLFKIAILYYILPLIIVSILIRIFFGSGTEHPILKNTVTQITTLFIAIPFMYLRYKWTVNVKYKEYIIQWDTDFWISCKTILLQVFLSIITIGIYYPLAMVKLYKYFAERTVAVSDTSTKKFGYDIEPQDDFLFIWGQLLLTFITLGIYYPWGFCKIADRISSKTYVEEVAVTE